MSKHSKLVTRFNNLVTNLNYNQIKIENIDIPSLKTWTVTHVPELLSELTALKWNLQDTSTWHDIFFLNSIVSMYGRKTLLYITCSWIDFISSKSVITSPKFDIYKDIHNIDCHCILLLNPIIFLQISDLDVIYDHVKQTDTCFLDLSCYDENEDIIPSKQEEWGWLSSEEVIWTKSQHDLVHRSIN